MHKALKWSLGLGAVLVLAGWGTFSLGPRPSPPAWPDSPKSIAMQPVEVAYYVAEKESLVPGLKENNEARVVWVDPAKKQKTKYSIVYLHGFSASQAEGEPVHTETARYYGCNLYLARLAGHGIEQEDIFLNLTADSLLATAEEAYAIGKVLGDSVIIMGTSTGAALALALASRHPEIKALVLYSPLIDFYDPNARLLAGPWGLQLGRLIIGAEHASFKPKSEERAKYWSTRYRIEGLVALSNFVNAFMIPATFQQVNMPVMLGYYYKNEEEQDKVVSVPAMKTMFEQLGTPAPLKRSMAFPEAGDHVIASYMTSSAWETVRDSTMSFLGNVVGLQPADELDEEKYRQANIRKPR
jgi:pimeloyl-ACP methyl ester carboxylesterase